MKNGFQEISSSLDLSFEDEAVADEKIPFLAYLASVLKNSSYFPFEPPAGSKRFCSLIAGFMRTYHRIPINQDVRLFSLYVFVNRFLAVPENYFVRLILLINETNGPLKNFLKISRRKNKRKLDTYGLIKCNESSMGSI